MNNVIATTDLESVKHYPQQGQEGPISELDSTILVKPKATPNHNPYDRNLGNTTSLRTALNAMCAHCMGCTEGYMEPGFREEIRNCTAPKCPLWHFRPYQQKAQEAPNSMLKTNASAEHVPEVKNIDGLDSSSLAGPSRGSQP